MTPWSELLYRANLNKESASMIIRPKELLELLAENARYREALEFYASGFRCDIYFGPRQELLDDEGKIAMKALGIKEKE